jgi:acyl carrier protein
MNKKLYDEVSQLIYRTVEEESPELSKSVGVTLDGSGSFMESLQVDSLLALEIVSRIEKKFGIQFQEEDFVYFDTIDNIVDLVDSKIKEKDKNNLFDKKKTRSKKEAFPASTPSKVKAKDKLSSEKKIESKKRRSLKSGSSKMKTKRELLHKKKITSKKEISPKIKSPKNKKSNKISKKRKLAKAR